MVELKDGLKKRNGEVKVRGTPNFLLLTAGKTMVLVTSYSKDGRKHELHFGHIKFEMPVRHLNGNVK